MIGVDAPPLTARFYRVKAKELRDTATLIPDEGVKSVKQHAVGYCRDDLATLRDTLDKIAREGGRIISVIWQPKRMVEDAGRSREARDGFVIVSEHESRNA